MQRTRTRGCDQRQANVQHTRVSSERQRLDWHAKHARLTQRVHDGNDGGTTQHVDVYRARYHTVRTSQLRRDSNRHPLGLSTVTDNRGDTVTTMTTSTHAHAPQPGHTAHTDTHIPISIRLQWETRTRRQPCPGLAWIPGNSQVLQKKSKGTLARAHHPGRQGRG